MAVKYFTSLNCSPCLFQYWKMFSSPSIGEVPKLQGWSPHIKIRPWFVRSLRRLLLKHMLPRCYVFFSHEAQWRCENLLDHSQEGHFPGRRSGRKAVRAWEICTYVFKCILYMYIYIYKIILIVIQYHRLSDKHTCKIISAFFVKNRIYTLYIIKLVIFSRCFFPTMSLGSTLMRSTSQASTPI